jgi:hypothetical protein
MAPKAAAGQRFSLAHEFKHARDNPFIDVLYPAKGGRTADPVKS